MTEFAVRSAHARDLERLVAFQLAMARETEGKALDGSRLRAGIQALLADPAKGRYLLATRGEETLGCLMLTTEWSDWRNAWFWWIQSVFTSPSARGQGVFRALYDMVLAQARARGDVCGLRLYVEQENRAAQAVYARVGMSTSHYRFYEIDLPQSSCASGGASVEDPSVPVRP